jgi:putative membrane protein
MKSFLGSWIINAISLWLLDFLMKSLAFPSASSVLTAGLAMAILNATIKPLLKILSLPVTILTLGLFALVIDGTILRIALKVSGAVMPSFGILMLASILLAIINSFVQKLFR